MLAPADRTLLLDALRPPEGCELDVAIATTYTLDLDALLLAPLAFALYDWITDDDGRPDPLALLEALRRHAKRVTVFGQAGEVGFRAAYRPLVVLLEQAVVPVAPPVEGAVFHPKLWALRFVDATETVRYRVLVGSRNLTFDRSWDTLLRLEGELQDDEVPESAPLAEMVGRLPGLATTPVAADRRTQVATVADELARVRFAVPEGFERLTFHPLGFGGAWPLPRRYDRALVISPFLTAGTLDRLAGVGGRHVLVSSPEAIDTLGDRGTGGFATRFALTAAALPAADDPTPVADAAAADDHGASNDHPPAVAPPGRPELDGLHAKLYLLEQGERARLFTGSANATDAAFHRNVELLVELSARRATHGIDTLLAPADSQPTFRTLLEEHTPATDQPVEPTPAEGAQLDLDRLRRALASLPITLRLEPDGDDHRAAVTVTGPLPEGLDELTTLEVWPISRGAGHRVPLSRQGDDLRADLGRLSTDGITAFLAVATTLVRGDVEVADTFVVPASLEGAPDDRARRVLTAMLRDRDDLLRYLLLLLADADLDIGALLDALNATDPDATDRTDRVDPPLLETMLRTLARQPDRLDHVERLVTDLRDDGRGAKLFPDGFDEVWDPIWTVRQELDR